MAKFLLGPGGRLMLAGGKPLSAVVAAGSSPSGTLTIPLTPWYILSTASTPRFNLHTSATSNDTTGNVPIIFTYTGSAPASVQARIIDAAGAAVSGFDWTDITSGVQTDSAGTCLAYLNGVPAGIGYKRQIRAGTSTTVTSTDSMPFNIGWMMLPWGQSNNRGTLEGNIGISGTIPPGSTTEGTFYTSNGTGAYFTWNGFAGNSSNNSVGDFYLHRGGAMALLRHVGNALQARFGRKVGIALNPWAQNGTPMTGFMAPDGVIAKLDAAGAAAPGIGFSSPRNVIAAGDYRIVSWHQGESEPSGVTRASRLADLIKFCQAHIRQVAKFGRQPSQLTFLFAIMGLGYAHPHMQYLRGAVMDLVDYGKTQGWDVRVGWNCIDLDPAPDSIHFAGDDLKRSLYRLTQSAMSVAHTSGIPLGAAGPSFDRSGATTVGGVKVLGGLATRAGDDVAITITHDGNANRTLQAKNPANPITGWYANTAADFSGTELVVSSVQIVDATHVKMTVKDSGGNAAPATFYIMHCGHKALSDISAHPNVSNLIYDNFAYPTGADPLEQFTGLPLWPTPDPIKVG